VGRPRKNPEPTVALAGSEVVKGLQEKQVDNLLSAEKSLIKVQENYDKAIEAAREELNKLYYEIKDAEAEVADMLAAAKDQIESADKAATEHRENKVSELEAKIKGLDKEFNQKRKDFEVSFALGLRESKESTLETLLDEFNLTSIDPEELTRLQEAEAAITEEMNKTVKQKVAIAETRAEKRRVADLKEQELKHIAETAKLEAQNENAEKQLDFYKTQLAAAEERVQAILDNQVEVAKAGKGISINTGNQK
jgi:hypothetical protein